jgi:hypothetical protein
MHRCASIRESITSQPVLQLLLRQLRLVSPIPQSFSAGLWLAAAAAASFIAVGLTGYLVATINLELFFRDPPPPATRGFALMQRRTAVNAVRLLLVTVALATTARACWELAHF